MVGTYSQIYVQVVFSPFGKENIIRELWSEELYKYISGIVRKKGQKLIAINGMSDHIHIFLGLKANMSVSSLVRDIKNNSSGFINDRHFVKGKFRWQEGFGAFSYGQSQINSVYHYIMNQKEHHKKVTFKEEYISFLKKFEVDFEEKYLFEWIE